MSRDVDAAVVSISSLPNELLAAIATAGQEDRIHWTLSHVSHRFCAVMVGTPALWTVLKVDLRFAIGLSLEILQLYLERSQKCSIAVTLEHTGRRGAQESETEPLALLIPHISRISWLRVVGAWRGQSSLLAPFRDLAAPNLQHLEVINLNHYSAPDPIEVFSGGAPRLRSLKLSEQKLPSPVSQWAASLTHLELRRCWPGNIDLDEILDKCSLLVYSLLDMSRVRLKRRARLLFLQTLHLVLPGMDDDFDLIGMVTIFDTPSLTECAIDGVHGDQIFELLSAKRPTDDSFPALTALFCRHL
ncbi:hypothetical protein C8R45DRAFT_986884 [Mycena sanguinolenta]|nr:hypothetical protein C8R45DRAFT_986884 [Mycena sanguinolenta]